MYRAKLGGARGRSELTEQAENKKKKKADGERESRNAVKPSGITWR